MRNIIVGIDIGTTKILTVISRVSKGSSAAAVIGYGFSRSRGLQKGVVVDVEEACIAVEDSIRAAEKMAGVKVRRAILSISGNHIKSSTIHGMLTVSKYPREITHEDRKKLEDIIENKVQKPDTHVIHKVTYRCRIDDGGIVRNPIGMIGCRIEADIHVVAGKVNAMESLMKCVRGLGISVDGLVIEALASAKAVLTDTEEQMGVALADIGGETVDLAVFRNGELVFSEVLPIGGEHITRDIATVLGVDLSTAENLKRGLKGMIEKGEETLEIPAYKTAKVRTINVSHLKSIVDSRVEEILDHIYSTLINSRHEGAIRSGTVFTGGASQTYDLVSRAEKQFRMPVRLGMPDVNLKVLDKINILEGASVIGLLIYSQENNENNAYGTNPSDVGANIFGFNLGSFFGFGGDN